jgi:hypothetical protein
MNLFLLNFYVCIPRFSLTWTLYEVTFSTTNIKNIKDYEQIIFK